ncbi:MAG TPA: glycosyltransferase [Puia sp.]
MSRSVIILGPAHPLRGGGITTFNHRLAKAFIQNSYDCHIYSFSLQYPSFLFPGSSQYTDEPPPEGLTIFSKVNSINPVNWWLVGEELRRRRPDIIVVRYWLPLMGPALGTILRRVRKNRHTRIVALTDNVIPHERRLGDTLFTKYFLKSCDAYITMSEKVMQDLRSFEKDKPALQVPHPLYDNFGEPVTRQEARAALRQKGLAIGDDDKVLLFFGFIRKYKGLDMLFDAMSDPHVKAAGIKLLVAGEFYEDERGYREQIQRLGIGASLMLRTGFIPDQDVKYYLCAADAVVQPYRHATQSGVTPLAYHFGIPMIVTDVGGLPSLVPHERVGLVVRPESGALAEGIARFFELGSGHFIPHLRIEREKYSWDKLVDSIIILSEKTAGSRT